jgi:O-acetyl-ADP-ribose deacetylase (regulator of RNase III)
MRINYEPGFAIEKDVEVVINSANNNLLLGTSGAGKIRELSSKLSFVETFNYWIMLKYLPRNMKKWYRESYKKHGWEVRKAQVSCLTLLLKNKGESYAIGSAILDVHTFKNKKIIHAVAMGYDTEKDKDRRIKATKNSLEESLENSLALAQVIKAKTIAVPIMCSRPDYGLNPKESLAITNKVLKKFDKAFDKVIVCLDNDLTLKLKSKL